MKKQTVLLSAALLLQSFVSFGQQKPIYKDPAQPVEKRVQDLLSRMTPEEKFWQCFMIPGDLDHVSKDQYKHGIFGFQVSAGTQGGGAAGQLLQYNANEGAEQLVRKINAIQKYFVEQSRLGIPIIPFDEALHGLMREGATAFPQAIGLASTFDPALMHEVATAIATESRLRGIRQILTPVVNLANDVRWGRTEETYGEDPYLSSLMGVAFVSAFEKQDIITTPKHFLANVGDGGRDSYPIFWNKRFLEETHLVPFKKAFQQGKSRSVMTAYNLIDGRPSTASKWLLTDKLKGEWKFDGFIISDASAVGGSTVLHYTAKDYPDASAQAINAGLDVIFQTEYDHYKLFMPPFLDGRISKTRIDDAVSRVLKAKFELGLFEQPYVSEKDIQKLVTQINNKPIAQQAAEGSFVLLQNQNQTLPINASYKKILIVGEEATAARLGGYSGPGNGKVSILQGIQEYAKGKGLDIRYAKGITMKLLSKSIIDPAYLTSGNAKGLKGEYFNNASLSGTPTFTRKDEKIDFSWTLGSPDDKQLKMDQYSIRWTGQITAPASGTYEIGLRGNDGYRLYVDNKLIVDKWEKESYSTSTAPFQFEKNKSYPIRVEFREMRGNAHIELVWNYGLPDYKKDYDEALAKAKEADYIIVTTGIHEGEFQDRALLNLEGNQEQFIQEVSLLNKPTTVVLVGGSAIKTTAWKDKVGAILNVWYPGEEGGHAIANTLFGKVSPSGKLPITYPVHEGQLPLVYNHHPTGRGDDYHHLSGEPLYPFGFGLSYSTFDFTNLTLETPAVSNQELIRFSVDVTNTGKVDAAEVTQVYVRDLLSSVSRPVLELKAFKKEFIKAGETKKIHFTLDPQELAFFDEQMNWTIEPGEYRILIGNSSKNLPLKVTVSIR
ncbi:glycoside hydrolase family 3 N-terminal domain-containing protein [Sphingobacterium spiritivorum]|uniref:glycoside hydrolase family 3 N-terminal domain-containing protein n=1 Tax=Sphingobacterium spiritivorum TaxID=258 RepID=UPI003DA4DB1F